MSYKKLCLWCYCLFSCFSSVVYAFSNSENFTDAEIFYGLSFRDIHGKKYSLRHQENKPIILLFFHYTDFQSLINLAQLDLLKESVGDDVTIIPIEILTINSEEKQKLRTVIASLKLKYLQIFIDDKATSAYYLNIKSVPTTIIINVYGKVALRVEGMYDWESNTVRQIFWQGRPIPREY